MKPCAVEDVDALVVGGGPAGLAAATALARAGVTVTVVDREAELGGIPRHTDHLGYGIREFHRMLRGPAYARAWVGRAERAGVDLRPATTVTGWAGGDPADREVTTTSPAGTTTIRARAVLLATGTRERPRPARLVPGTRPLGVLTTGALQQLVALRRERVGRRAVVVGAEHVSFSAVLTLRHARCAVAAMITGERRHQSYAALRLVTAGRWHVPVLTRTLVTDVLGQRRVEAVEITDLDTGAARRLDCDTVVFTGDWVPDHELARSGDLVMDPGTRAPRVDDGYRTSAPGVFAAGNLLHGAETAGVCARDGAWVASAMLDWLRWNGVWPMEGAVPVECAPPLLWVSPNAVAPGAAVPHGRFVLRSAASARRPRVAVAQGDRELWSARLRRTTPTMPVHLPAGWLRRIDPDGGAVRVSVERSSVT